MEEFFGGLNDSDSDDDDDDVQSGNIEFGFGNEFEIKKDDKQTHLFEGDGSDDEDRSFFEALANGFSQRSSMMKTSDGVD